MPVNTQTVAAIESLPVPPDLECVPGNMTVLLARAAQFLRVVSVTAEIDQQSTNSIAQQALELAQIALNTAQAAAASVAQKRSNGAPQDVTAGDSVFPISWTTAMPNTNYEVRATIYGPNSAAAAYYGMRVVDGTRTVNGVSLRLDNFPANSKLSWVVESLPST